MSSDPRLWQLASEAAQKIKAVPSDRSSQIQSIYEQYQHEAAVIRGESSTDGIESAPALLSQPHPTAHQNDRSIPNYPWKQVRKGFQGTQQKQLTGGCFLKQRKNKVLRK